MKRIFFCNECGREILREDELFCRECGNRIIRSSNTQISEPKNENIINARDIQIKPNKISNYIEKKSRVWLGGILIGIGLVIFLASLLIGAFEQSNVLSFGILGLFPLIPLGFLIFVSGLKRQVQGIVLMGMGVLSTLIFIIAVFTPTNFVGTFINVRIIADAFGEIIFFVIFITPGALLYLEKSKNIDIFIVISWIYLSIRSSIPIILFFPSEWWNLSLLIVANFTFFWFLAFIVNRLILKYSDSESASIYINLNVFAILFYISFFSLAAGMFVYDTLVINVGINFYDFYFTNYTYILGFGFLAGVGMMFIYLLGRYTDVFETF
ncbi:MAG: hypothetical protein ACFFAS_06680 [Promethearchaeota archaeon]